MKVLAHGMTVRGLAHPTNEDSILIDRTRHLYAVADGVTLPYGGQKASTLVIKNLGLLFNYDLRKSFEDTNNKLLGERLNDQSIGSTTLTAAHLSEGMLYAAYVGDSPAYIIREEMIKRITEPDVVPGTHMLIQVMGQRGLDIHLVERPVTAGDMVVLASDGVTDAISENEILMILRENADGEKAVEAIIHAVDEKPRIYHDDKSIIVVTIK